MKTHLEIFKEMIEAQTEFPRNLLLERTEGTISYLIEGREAYVLDDEKQECLGDYSDEVYDLISERIFLLDQDHRDVVETENYLRAWL